jgi:hypothetical protein
VKNWFQAFAFKCNSYRCTEGRKQVRISGESAKDRQERETRLAEFPSFGAVAAAAAAPSKETAGSGGGGSGGAAAAKKTNAWGGSQRPSSSSQVTTKLSAQAKGFLPKI